MFSRKQSSAKKGGVLNNQEKVALLTKRKSVFAAAFTGNGLNKWIRNGFEGSIARTHSFTICEMNGDTSSVALECPYCGKLFSCRENKSYDGKNVRGFKWDTFKKHLMKKTCKALIETRSTSQSHVSVSCHGNTSL